MGGFYSHAERQVKRENTFAVRFNPNSLKESNTVHKSCTVGLLKNPSHCTTSVCMAVCSRFSFCSLVQHSSLCYNHWFSDYNMHISVLTDRSASCTVVVINVQNFNRHRSVLYYNKDNGWNGICIHYIWTQLNSHGRFLAWPIWPSSKHQLRR